MPPLRGLNLSRARIPNAHAVGLRRCHRSAARRLAQRSCRERTRLTVTRMTLTWLHEHVAISVSRACAVYRSRISPQPRSGGIDVAQSGERWESVPATDRAAELRHLL